MENIKQTVLINFTRLLEKSGLKQKFIAKTLGVSEVTVLRWKKGEACPTMDNIESLAKVFNVSPYCFFEKENRRPTIEEALDVLGLEAKRDQNKSSIKIPEDLIGDIDIIDDDTWNLVRSKIKGIKKRLSSQATASKKTQAG